MVPVSSHERMPAWNHASEPSTVQMVEYGMFILVSPAFRPSSPTSPGQSPTKFATVRIGPRWVRSPARTWWLYCQTASATIRGASAGMDSVSYTHLRAHETVLDLVCRLL